MRKVVTTLVLLVSLLTAAPSLADGGLEARCYENQYGATMVVYYNGQQLSSTYVPGAKCADHGLLTTHEPDTYAAA